MTTFNKKIPNYGNYSVNLNYDNSGSKDWDIT